MQRNLIFLFCTFFLLVFAVSCSDGDTNMGAQIQPEGDKIIVDTASISLKTYTDTLGYIYSKPDSFLLGTFIDTQYGTLRADILTQLQPAVDFAFPEIFTADSAILYMTFFNWFGAKYDPMQIKVYQMNKGTFAFSSSYRSNLAVGDYCDKSILLGDKVISARDVTVKDSSKIKIPLSADFLRTFSDTILHTIYANDPATFKNPNDKYYRIKKERDFQTFFNGLYITTEFGSASMLYLQAVNMKIFFHYKTVEFGDSVIKTVSQDYPFTNEVRLVNRFERHEQTAFFQSLKANSDVDYISSPANFVTKITMSLRELKEKTKTNGKKLLFNRTMLTAELAELNTETLPQPVASSLMLLKDEAYNRFFSKRELPSDTCAILSSVTYKTVNDSIVYAYDFDIANLLTTELEKGENAPDSLTFRLVPVALSRDASGNTVEVKEQNRMTVTKIKSGKNGDKAMKISVVYSGF